MVFNIDELNNDLIRRNTSFLKDFIFKYECNVNYSDLMNNFSSVMPTFDLNFKTWRIFGYRIEQKDVLEKDKEGRPTRSYVKNVYKQTSLVNFGKKKVRELSYEELKESFKDVYKFHAYFTQLKKIEEMKELEFQSIETVDSKVEFMFQKN